MVNGSLQYREERASSHVHLISIPVTNTSANPARATGPALIEGGIALQQLLLFWLAPIIGCVLGALAYNWVAGVRRD